MALAPALGTEARGGRMTAQPHPDLSITSSPEAAPGDIETIHEGLRTYNEHWAGPTGFRRVHLFARDETGRVRAGLVGKQIWDWLYVDLLWVDETLRRQGLGRRL